MPRPGNLEDRLKKLMHERGLIRKELENVMIFTEGVKTDFWKALEDQFKNKLLSIERNLDQFEDKTDKAIMVLLSSRKQIRGFIGIRDYSKMKTNFEKMLSRKQEEIETLTEKIDGGK